MALTHRRTTPSIPMDRVIMSRKGQVWVEEGLADQRVYFVFSHSNQTWTSAFSHIEVDSMEESFDFLLELMATAAADAALDGMGANYNEREVIHMLNLASISPRQRRDVLRYPVRYAKKHLSLFRAVKGPYRWV